MLAQERQATASMAAIYAFRMLGLFMVLPVLSLHVGDIEQASPFLIGAALGAYGLTQAALQIPFGMLSDKIGRKPIICLGLTMLMLGSILAASATTIYGLIIGRALQGAGAIGAALLALLSDMTRETVRTKAMAIVGITIGAAFSLAMLIGPSLDAAYGLNSIFMLTGGLALVGFILMLRLDVPAVPKVAKASIREALLSPALKRLSLSICCLHASLTILFLQLPWQINKLTTSAGVTPWRYYLPTMILAVCALRPLLKLAEPIERTPTVLRWSIGGLLLAQLIIGLSNHMGILMVGMIGFFMIFNLLEAMLPSLVSRLVPPDRKGAALGVYSTSQFFGVFVGGITGGALLQHFNELGILAGCIACALLWQIGLVGWRVPPKQQQ